MMVAEHIEITGIVQGVGFRPFVYRMATNLGLCGRVWNNASNVSIDVFGPAQGLQTFAERLQTEAPPLARIDQIRRSNISAREHADSFSIAESPTNSPAVTAAQRTHVPPDATTCADCLQEFWDPKNRRFKHPFITCTNCGPRFSIIQDLPYDRPNTTMSMFAMCDACEREYTDPANRRYHAQPISCYDCGPTLSYRRFGGPRLRGQSAVELAVVSLELGQTVAVKGIGGFQLVCRADDHLAVAQLRDAKQRPDKPFAVMVADVEAARQFAFVGPAEEEELRSSAAPIVLLRAQQSGKQVASNVAPNNPLLGIMLANTPVHHLILSGACDALVVTSANHAGTPMVFTNAAAVELEPLANGVLENDRDIHVPCDDSVVRLVGDERLPIRRARGYAPVPLAMPAARRSVLAVGAELKNTFALVRPEVHLAWVSQHIGDMGNLETLEAFDSLVGHFENMYEVEPDILTADMHPGYLSTRWAERESTKRGIPLLKVQHHHAHVAAVMAEHQIDPQQEVLGFAFDGTGYGQDGSIWGGEILRGNTQSFERVASLRPVDLPGGDSAARSPFRCAAAHLHAAGLDWESSVGSRTASQNELQILAKQLERSLGCITSSSMGRLFDAVASLLDLHQVISFEAQAAISLEMLALSADDSADDVSPYTFELDSQGCVFDPAPVLGAILNDLAVGRAPSLIAAGFHQAVADVIARLADRHLSRPEQPVILSGGVFQNALLTSLCLKKLRSEGRTVFTHSLVPANDGGLALGQAYIAAHHPQ